MIRFENVCRALAVTAALAALGGCATEDAKPVAVSGNNCPAWTEHPADAHSNAPSLYLGCTNAVNLEHMVENPADLDAGRELGPADGDRETMSVTNYKEGKVKQPPDSASHTTFTPLMTQTTTGGQ